MSMPTTEITPRRTMARVAIASCAGTTIEFYDFFIYGTAAALVFPHVFFPALGDAAATTASFATFAVAFIARPFGAVFFGHFGDRIGRKKTLVSTLLLMGVSTVLMGLIPDADAIGAAAPTILIILRFAQGVALGGEWAGATLLAAEYAPREKRGFYGVFPQLGPSLGLFLASGAYLLTIVILGDSNDTFLSYGWRLPFIASIALILVGLYVRLRLEETPAFAAAQKTADTARSMPVLEALRRQPKEILLVGGALTMLFAFFYIGTSYLTNYGSNPEGADLSRVAVLSVAMIASVIFGLATVAAGTLSDRFGRRNLIITASVVGLIWAFLLFPLLDTGSLTAFAIGQTVTLVMFGIAYGPAGSFLPELFDPQHRYTGAGLGYNLAGVVGGGLAPVLAGALTPVFGGMGVGIMLAAAAVISIVCVIPLRETQGHRLAHEHTSSSELTPQ